MLHGIEQLLILMTENTLEGTHYFPSRQCSDCHQNQKLINAMKHEKKKYQKQHDLMIKSDELSKICK